MLKDISDTGQKEDLNNSFKLKFQLAFAEAGTLARGQILQRAASLVRAQVCLLRRMHAEADLRSAVVCGEEILAVSSSSSSPAKTSFLQRL